jgi:hypothetical protein
MNTMNKLLYHVSEVEGIVRFEPRPARPRPGAPDGEMVWAIDDAHLFTYLLPRDCPRMTFWAKPDSAERDILRFLGSTTARRVLCIESGWLARAMNHRLYIYSMPADTFGLEDANAGHYISRQAVTPAGVQVIDQPLAHLAQRDVELRVMPSLWDLREAVLDSTLDFSITRMRNAAPAPDGFVTKYPVS